MKLSDKELKTVAYLVLAFGYDFDPDGTLLGKLRGERERRADALRAAEAERDAAAEAVRKAFADVEVATNAYYERLRAVEQLKKEQA